MKVIMVTGTSKANIDSFVAKSEGESEHYVEFPELYKHPIEFKKDIYALMGDVKESEAFWVVTLNKFVVNIVIDYLEENNIPIENFELTHVKDDEQVKSLLCEEYCFKNCEIGFMDY